MAHKLSRKMFIEVNTKTIGFWRIQSFCSHHCRHLMARMQVKALVHWFHFSCVEKRHKVFCLPHFDSRALFYNLKTTVTMFASPALMKYSNRVNVSVFQA